MSRAGIGHIVERKKKNKRFPQNVKYTKIGNNNWMAPYAYRLKYFI